MTDAFDDIDEFDLVELDSEDKVLYSKELKDLLRREIAKAMNGIPQMISKENERQRRMHDTLKSSVLNDIEKKTAEIEKQLRASQEASSQAIDKIRERYDDLRNNILSAPQYQFGGFSPLVNTLNIGDPASEGSWRIVRSGTTLSVQRFESSAWVEKGQFS